MMYNTSKPKREMIILAPCSGRTECRIGHEILNRIKKCRIRCRIGHEIGIIKANFMLFDRECVS